MGRTIYIPSMTFQITIRYGGRRQRYHTFTVEASDARDALGTAAREMPDAVAADADLVEVRIAVDPDARSFADG